MKLTDEDIEYGNYPNDMGSSWFGLVINYEPKSDDIEGAEKETEEWGKQLKKQILQWQEFYEKYYSLERSDSLDWIDKLKEKAEKYDDLMAANSEVVKNNITLSQCESKVKHLENENKELKEFIQKLNNMNVEDFVHYAKTEIRIFNQEILGEKE